MNFRIQRVEEASIVMIEGKLLSEQEAAPVREQISSLLNSGSGKFIFDLKGIEFVNSSCLNFLVSSKNLISSKNGTLVLCNVPDQLNKLLAVTKLQSFFGFAGRTADAIEMLR